MDRKLSPVQLIVATLTAAGKKAHEIAPIAYPNQAPASGRASVARVLQNDTVKSAIASKIQTALEKHKITVDDVAEVTKDAMGAQKWNDFTGENLPDHKTRLAAARDALKLIKDADNYGAIVDDPVAPQNQEPAKGGDTYNFITVTNEDKKEFDL